MRYCGLCGFFSQESSITFTELIAAQIHFIIRESFIEISWINSICIEQINVFSPIIQLSYVNMYQVPMHDIAVSVLLVHLQNKIYQLHLLK